jgi:hypothetical protein
VAKVSHADGLAEKLVVSIASRLLFIVALIVPSLLLIMHQYNYSTVAKM